MEIGDTQTR